MWAMPGKVEIMEMLDMSRVVELGGSKVSVELSDVEVRGSLSDYLRSGLIANEDMRKSIAQLANYSENYIEWLFDKDRMFKVGLFLALTALGNNVEDRVISVDIDELVEYIPKALEVRRYAAATSKEWLWRDFYDAMKKGKKQVDKFMLTIKR